MSQSPLPLGEISSPAPQVKQLDHEILQLTQEILKGQKEIDQEKEKKEKEEHGDQDEKEEDQDEAEDGTDEREEENTQTQDDIYKQRCNRDEPCIGIGPVSSRNTGRSHVSVLCRKRDTGIVLRKQDKAHARRYPFLPGSVSGTARQYQYQTDPSRWVSGIGY
ncbi:hypothetical protein KEM48_001128 [Puccinia striiformis f. sp. tritici PST-130]|nr:hypothetical protein H4Q26_001241 [Puccinia striiformis f. sp. tritici PST-130]KAI9601842.1 hypothetical protein KEM48_001128 [Puccinia striiformis f. sp. tritici PST-130]